MRVLISQRVDAIPERNELRDSLDREWFTVLEALFGAVCLIPVPNHTELAERVVAEVEPELVVLTGGNDLSGLPGAVNVSAQRDAVERILLDRADRASIPLLAVCRGFQHLNRYLGGTLSRCDGHVGIAHDVAAVTSTCERFRVNSFHGYGVSEQGLADALEPLYLSSDGWIEAAKHRERSWLGIMWHPERHNPDQDRQLHVVRQYFHESES